jgi:hypothetical protein
MYDESSNPGSRWEIWAGSFGSHSFFADYPVRTSFQSPWQNGIAERCVESCRRDLLDHVIAFDEAHVKRLLRDYVSYYHDDRTHLGLEKNTSSRLRSAARGRVTSLPRLGGLHHRYERAAWPSKMKASILRTAGLLSGVAVQIAGQGLFNC